MCSPCGLVVVRSPNTVWLVTLYGRAICANSAYRVGVISPLAYIQSAECCSGSRICPLFLPDPAGACSGSCAGALSSVQSGKNWVNFKNVWFKIIKALGRA